MVEITSAQERMRRSSPNYDLIEPEEVDPDAPMHAHSESSDDNRQEVPSGAAIAKMKKLA